MKKSIFALALATMAFAATPAFAQQKSDKACNDTCVRANAYHNGEAKQICPGKGEYKGHHRDHGPKMRKGNPLMQGIELTDAQQAKLKELNSERMKSVKEIKERSKADIKKVRKASAKKLEKILTPEQLKQYNDNKAKLQARKDARKDNDKKGNRRFDKRRDRGHHGHGHHQDNRQLSAQL